jgi:putative proteasome-type protease
VTYGLGILLRDGLILASDSRSNAGVDQVVRVKKMTIYEQPGARVMFLLAAGNLATTQSVTEYLEQSFDTGTLQDLYAAATLFDAVQIIGDLLRGQIARDGPYLGAGEGDASFLFGGQIAGSEHRLFLVYPAGNFIEASERCPYLQIGETKYGKPILDRTIDPDLSLEEATKVALLSFDATMRSNLSVGPPIDLVRYRAGSLTADQVHEFDSDNAYLRALSKAYSEGLAELVQRMPVIDTPPLG